MQSQANKQKRNGKLPKAFIVDSTTISLNKTRYPWAEFRTTKSGVKVHLRLAYIGKGDAYPDSAVITNASVHDVNQLEIVVDERLATYIFDRGYLDFELFDKFSHDGFFFISRIRKNSLVKVREEYEVPSGGTIFQDQMVVLGGKNGYLTDPYRLVEVMDTQENLLRIITNQFDLPSEEIGQMYRARWEIELFFKQLKQHTTIKKFFSRNEDGLKNQVYLALISQLLTYLVKLETQSVLSSLTIQRYLFASLWEDSELGETRIRGKPTGSD
ncbi:IS4 transposase [Trichococcus patagoniensis]|uniref:IS4 transposase n=1 Tax=Trichococcus patagoniensis TaxID=382641 RepID=A0A2T5IEG8_9LACT|nr:IS4 family transposase [Trichococcus patagoniensis]PTQ82228.1 IS4 transposase [Trichococcus patagoniensis]